MDGTMELTAAGAQKDERTAKMVLYIGIFSIVMLFAGLSSAYVISSHNEIWVQISLPMGFYISTGLILLSSLTISLAVKAAERGAEAALKQWVLLTLLLGLGFGVSQFMAWSELTAKGNYLSSHIDNLDGEYGKDYEIMYRGEALVYENEEFYLPGDALREKPMMNEIAIYGNSASSYLYILSAVHLLHVLGGIIFLFVLALLIFFAKRKNQMPMRLRLGATYWHFVDGLWIYLFLFLLFIH